MFRKIGLPIGNLTSQIFANIYLNEFDRFVVHTLKPKAYLRYGDDFIMFAEDEHAATTFRRRSEIFLRNALRLELHRRNNVIVKARQGVHFLGADIFPNGRRLRKRMRCKIFRKISRRNLASYLALLKSHEKPSRVREILWKSAKLIEDF
jgi:RNA-directed DNA polymerase